ncbi:MmyB family transcriptional regulator [Nonomuraea sp. KM90]|uniref:MmyB family transcriptional regulator n=1 Tax=Nonomuraea sp. KM90 TaxID=3457428 RepID=UPI003FCEAE94
MRAAQARYPDDPDLIRMIAEPRRGSRRFDELWREGRSSPWRAATKSIRHPSLGTLSLDCDIMLLPDGNQTVLVYSAEAGSPEATALDMLRGDRAPAGVRQTVPPNGSPPGSSCTRNSSSLLRLVSSTTPAPDCSTAAKDAWETPHRRGPTRRPARSARHWLRTRRRSPPPDTRVRRRGDQRSAPLHVSHG